MILYNCSFHLPSQTSTMDSTHLNPRHTDSGRANQFSSMDRLGPTLPNNGDMQNEVGGTRESAQQRRTPTDTPEVVEETR